MPDGSANDALNTGPSRAETYEISLLFPATEAAVRRASQSVRHALKAEGLSDVTLGTVEIVLVEAANNIVEHAYANTGRGVVRLGCTHGNGVVRFELSDCGRPLPGGEMPAKKQHDLSAEMDDLPEGGFGWGLIRDMTAALSYSRDGARNVLRFAILAE